jgi:hypothetical protein
MTDMATQIMTDAEMDKLQAFPESNQSGLDRAARATIHH